MPQPATAVLPTEDPPRAAQAVDRDPRLACASRSRRKRTQRRIATASPLDGRLFGTGGRAALAQIRPNVVARGERHSRIDLVAKALIDPLILRAAGDFGRRRRCFPVNSSVFADTPSNDPFTELDGLASRRIAVRFRPSSERADLVPVSETRRFRNGPFESSPHPTVWPFQGQSWPA
jgi:hypothetical protein